MLNFFFGVVEATLVNFQRTDGEDVGIISGDRPGKGAGVVLHRGLLADFRGDVGDLRNVGGQRVHVVQGKADGGAGLGAAGLHGSGAGNHDDHLGAEVGKDIGAGLTEAVAVGEQHHYRGDAPGHAEHGQRAAAAVVTHRLIGFLEQVVKHIE